METKTEVKKLINEEFNLHSKAVTEAEKIKMLMIFSVQIDVDFLEKGREELHDAIGSYEAIGIIDGNAYLTKIYQYRAKLARLDAIILFVKALKETNDVLQKDPNSGIDISGMFWL